MSEAWIEALSFAALPGAAKVRFERRSLTEDGTPTTRYSLRCETETGQVIGDDRDYDLLKAAMSPLEKLSDTVEQDAFVLELDLKNRILRSLDPA